MKDDEDFVVEIASVFYEVLPPEETNKLLIEIVKEIRNDERTKVSKGIKQPFNIDSDMPIKRLDNEVVKTKRDFTIQLADSNESKFDDPRTIGED